MTYSVNCYDYYEENGVLMHPTEVQRWDCTDDDCEYTHEDYATTTCASCTPTPAPTAAVEETPAPSVPPVTTFSNRGCPGWTRRVMAAGGNACIDRDEGILREFKLVCRTVSLTPKSGGSSTRIRATECPDPSMLSAQ